MIFSASRPVWFILAGIFLLFLGIFGVILTAILVIVLADRADQPDRRNSSPDKEPD